jgi:flap endonuclease-1
MGIRHLNRYLRTNCTKKSIKKVHLKSLDGKTVVIDASIYLYKFLGDNALMENMYLFTSILKSYNIKPIFIFDGKPPPEKYELLKMRRLEKKEAEQKYRSLEASINENNIEPDEKKEIKIEMEQLKKQFIRLREDDIKKVKNLFDAYGVCYYDACGEADKLCAYLVNIEKAWGCFSDDMDMFLYECPFIIRHLSLLNHTVILYDKKLILEELNMNELKFREIMVLSGTDYNIDSNTNLYETLKWHNQYNKYLLNCFQNDTKSNTFYVWLFKNTKYIEDFNKLLRAYQLFTYQDNDLINWKNIEIVEKCEDLSKLRDVMGKEGFLFAR